MSWKIYDKTGRTVRAEATDVELHGEFKGECYVSADVASDVPVRFEIGDYMDYRGERYEINYDPAIVQAHKERARGDSFVYEGVKLNWPGDELVRRDFLDYVKEDNRVHYSSMGIFSFYAESVRDLTDRLQANLDLTYQGLQAWTIDVNPEAEGETDLNVDVSGMTLWDAVCLIDTLFKLNFTVKGRVIRVGYPPEVVEHEFVLDRDKGMTALEYSSDSNQKVVTRLRAYGGTDNLPEMYYPRQLLKGVVVTPIHSRRRDFVVFNTEYSALKFTEDRVSFIAEGNVYSGTWTKGGVNYSAPFVTLDGGEMIPEEGLEVTAFVAGADMSYFPDSYLPDNMAITNLMLPLFPSVSDVERDLGDGYKLKAGLNYVYIESPEVERIGVRDGSVTFDGSDEDLENIVPSLTDMTAEDLRGAGIDVELDEGDNGKMDEVAGASRLTDDGTEAKSERMLHEYYSREWHVEKEGQYLDGEYMLGMPSSVFSGKELDVKIESGKTGLPVAKIVVPSYAEWTDQGMKDWAADNLKVSVCLVYRDQKGEHRTDERVCTVILSTVDSSFYIEVPSLHVNFEEKELNNNVFFSINVDLGKKNDGGADLLPEGSKMVVDAVVRVGEFYNEKFEVWVKDIGFDLNDYMKEGSTATLGMTIGMCGGRNFPILGGQYKPRKEGNKWVLTCQRVQDSTLKLWFPYKDYNIEAGDRFILTEINMPYVYVRAASERLLRNALEWLKENDKTKFTYKPTLDNLFLARHPDVAEALAPGVRLCLVADGGHGNVVQTVDQLTIKEGEDYLPQYEVTLRDEKPASGISKLVNQVKAMAGRGGGSVDEELLRRMFLKRNVADSTTGLLKLIGGLETGEYTSGVSGGKMDAEGNAEVQSAVVRRMLRSTAFRNGLTGEGWRLWMDGDGLAELELDKLTVRQTMTVFELIIDRIKAVGGQLIVSAADGKIAGVEDLGDAYGLTFEAESGFEAGDLIRCQVFGDGEKGLRGYWVEVKAVDDGVVVVEKSEFSPYGTEPEEGDECVLMGNTRNPLRQNLISISATEDGQPRIDVLNGVSRKSFDGCLRARLGNLDGIKDSYFPDDAQPEGDGLYADNAYLRGRFVVVNRDGTSEDVLTKFEVTDGKIEQLVETTRDEIEGDAGYLNNPLFVDGMSHWTTENDVKIYSAGGLMVMTDGRLLASKGRYSAAERVDGLSVCHIVNNSIRQNRADFRDRPEVNGTVETYLKILCKCVKGGRLTVVLHAAMMDIEIDLGRIDSDNRWKTYRYTFNWGWADDISFGFTGDIYVSSIVMSIDAADMVENRYRTLFAQSDKIVRIAAENFDEFGRVKESSNIVTTAKFNAVMSGMFDEEGRLINTSGLVTTAGFSTLFAAELTEQGVAKTAEVSVMIAESLSKIKLSADQVVIDGDVTINSVFRVTDDGNVEANNILLRGYLYSSFIDLTESDAEKVSDVGLYYGEYKLRNNLYVDATQRGVVLPVSDRYEGARVIVMDSIFYQTRIAIRDTTIRTEDGSRIISGYFKTGDELEDSVFDADKLFIRGGAVEFVLKRNYEYEMGGSGKFSWILINSSCHNLSWEKDGHTYSYKYNL